MSKTIKTHKFWDTQPVTKYKDVISKPGPIKKLESNDIETKLPSDCAWIDLDLTDKKILNRITNFVNICNIKKGKFTQYYSPEQFKWHLMIGVKPTFALAVVRGSTTLGVIIGHENTYKVNRETIKLVETKILCISKFARGRRLVPVLIKEFTRRCVNKGYQQSLYVTNTLLPRPFYLTKQFFRTMNVDKMVKCGFTVLDDGMSIDNLKKAYELDSKPSNEGFLKLDEDSVEQAYDIFTEYNDRYNLYPIYTLDEFKYIFCSKFVTAYILIEDGEVIDFTSYIKTSLKKKQKKDTMTINVANLYHYTSNIETVYRLTKDLLIVSKEDNIDLFSAMDIMENEEIFIDLNFTEANAIFYYYLYNYKCGKMNGTQINKPVF